MMPFVDFFYDWQPSAIDYLSVEFGEPRPKTLRDAIGYPETNFIIGLHRVLPAIFIFDADAKNTSDCLLPHGGAIFFTIFAVCPWRHQTATTLTVSEERWCKLANRFHIERAECTAACVRDVTGFRVDLLDLLIPQSPQFKESCLVPQNVLAS